jgi:Ca2+-binding RTX toxin-like protein
MAGEDGDDEMTGDRGSDRMFGGNGNDEITGGFDIDTIDGGPGDDVINAKDQSSDTVECGAGTDRAAVDRNDRVSGCEIID